MRSGDIFTKALTGATISDYSTLLKNYTKEWYDTPVHQIDRAMGWKLLDHMDRTVSITRRKKLRSAIDSVFSWGFLSGRIKGTQFSPTEGYKTSVKQEEKIPEILNLSEIKQLLSSAKIADHEWYPIWAMALLTGMRNGELFALTWNKIDLETGILYVHENRTSKDGIGPTKGRYWRTIPISEELGILLKKLKLKSKGGYEEEVWKYTSPQRSEKVKYVEKRFVLPRFKSWTGGEQADVLRAFCEGIGITSIKFHTLRSCFATQLIKDGVAPAIIMKIAGWKDLKTMQRYVRLAGIEVDGATESLKILPADSTMGRVTQLFSSPGN